MSAFQNADIIEATKAFLNAMRREALKRDPSMSLEECRVPIWENMSMEDRGVVLRSIKAGLIAASESANARNSNRT